MSPHVLDRLSAYLDGELPPEDRALVAEHLAGCEECSRRLQALGIVDAAARELPAEPPARYFRAFPSRVRRRLQGDTRERSWRAPAWTWAAAAAALLAVVAPLTLMRSHPPAGSPQEEKAPPAPGFASTPLAALPEAPAAASPAGPTPRPGELQAQLGAREPRAEGSAGTPGAAGGRAASADTLAPRPPTRSRRVGHQRPRRVSPRPLRDLLLKRTRRSPRRGRT
jgi:anti-sigma factor RsiW